MNTKETKFNEYVNYYCNWREITAISITFDIDWAPDFMIREVLDVLENYSITATFFATHESKLLQKVVDDGRHEVGLHPNLSRGSTQGDGVAEVVEYLRAFYPLASGNRFHILGMSYRDLLWMGANNIEYDVSRILFNAPYLVPAWHADLNMVLFPYMWEDGVCENQGLVPSLKTMDLGSPGMKILNFHPMNTYINCSQKEDRLAFQRANPDLLNCTADDAAPFRKKGEGAGTALIELCEFVQSNNIKTLTLKEMYREFPKIIYGVKS